MCTLELVREVSRAVARQFGSVVMGDGLNAPA